MAEPKNESDTLANLEAGAITALSGMLGFPVPPTVARSVFKAVTALVGATVALPVTFLQGWAQEMRARSDARVKITNAMAKAAVKRVGEDEDLADRALLFFGGRIVREQRTRELIAHEAIKCLKEGPPTEDATRQIDEDWLDMFARHAETKTNEEMRTYFARVLAGEIRKPGSFAPETIDVLAKLSPEVALQFQRLCSLTAEIRGEDPLVFMLSNIPEANALAPYGLPYETLLRLDDAGLVRANLNIHVTIKPMDLQRAVIAGQLLLSQAPMIRHDAGEAERVATLRMHAQLTGPMQFPVVSLRAAGIELRRIVHMTPDDAYVAKFVEFLGQLGLQPV